MKKANTKFGSQIIVGFDNEFSVFLPTRISKTLENNPEQFQYMLEASAEDRLLTLVANTISANFRVCKKKLYPMSKIIFYSLYLISSENVRN